MNDRDICASCGYDQFTLIRPCNPGPAGWGLRCNYCGRVIDWQAQIERETEAMYRAIAGEEEATDDFPF